MILEIISFFFFLNVIRRNKIMNIRAIVNIYKILKYMREKECFFQRIFSKFKSIIFL